VKFAFKGGTKGDEQKVSWTDNQGATDSLTATMQ
jgi:sulfur-oxidizing protein SoxZ